MPSQPEQLPQPPQDFTEDEPVEEPVDPFTEVPPRTASKEISIEDDVGPTYEELYAPKVPQRRLGYFLVHLLVLSFLMIVRFEQDLVKRDTSPIQVLPLVCGSGMILDLPGSKGSMVF